MNIYIYTPRLEPDSGGASAPRVKPPQESRGAYAPLIRGLFSIAWPREVRAQEYIVPGEFRTTEGSAIFLEMNTGPELFTCAFLAPNRADLALPAFLEPN